MSNNPNRPESAIDLDTLVNKWAKKGPGWNSREYPPQYVTLDGGCQLIVMVPRLWAGRVAYAARPRSVGNVYPFKRAADARRELLAQVG